MRLFNVDQHISVIADVKRALGPFGHTVDDVCLSGHSYVMGRYGEGKEYPELTGDSWYNVLGAWSWDEVAKNHAAEWGGYDGYACCFPPLFQFLFRPFGKPVLLDIAIRYDYGVYNRPEDLARLNAGMIDPNTVLVCNSKFDLEYLCGFLPELRGKVTHIPSICDYTGMAWRPTDRRGLYYATGAIPEVERLGGAFVRKENVLKAGYSWADVGRFACVVHFPYQVSTMSIFEQYTANIPLLFPTKRFMLELYERGIVLEHWTGCKTAKSEPKSYQEWKGGEFDPNQYDDPVTVAHWMNYADYYDSEWMPYLIYFDSFQEMASLASNSKLLTETHEKMRFANAVRQQQARRLWGEVSRRMEVLSERSR